MKFMEVKCVRCGKKFQISKERLETIRSLQLEEMGPADYLDLFPLIAGRCTRKGFEDKKHSFVYTEEFKEDLRGLLRKYDELVLKGKELEKEKIEIEALGTKLTEEADEIRRRLDEIRDILYKNGILINDISVKEIDNVNDMNIWADKFRDATGIFDIDIERWGTVILSG